ncbi:hypothetical protein ACFL57_02370 [Candidatus Margulisiibacteriota bacterium]
MKPERASQLVQKVMEMKEEEQGEVLDMKKLVLEQALRENLLLKGRDFPVVSL